VSYFLGNDGGATKTHIVLSNGTGRPVVEGQSGPSNYHIVGVDQAAANLSAAISQALTDSAVVPHGVKAACAGLAGFDGASDKKNVQEILTSALQASGVDLPYQLLLALPFLLTIVALVLNRSHSQVPLSLTIPYHRGER